MKRHTQIIELVAVLKKETDKAGQNDISFSSFSVCTPYLPSAWFGDWESAVIRESIQLCHAVMPAMLCYAMRSIVRSAEYSD